MAPLFCLDCLRSCHGGRFGENIHFILHGLDHESSIGNVVVDIRSWDRIITHFTVPSLCFAEHAATTDVPAPWYEECGLRCSICNMLYIEHSFVEPIERFEESYSDLRSYEREKQRLRRIQKSKRTRADSHYTVSISHSSDCSSASSEDLLARYEDCYNDCPLCNGMYEEDELAQASENSGLIDTYRDFRSAARDKQRRRTIRENKSGRCNSYKCRKRGQTEQRTRNKRVKREKLKLAVEESQQVLTCYTRNFVNPAKHQVIEWDVRLLEDLDDWVINMNDDVVRYTTLHHGANIFESAEPYTKVGEDFASWARRRITEMRNVKDHRVLSGAPPVYNPVVWKRQKSQRYSQDFDVYTGDASITTLPTNTYDALGHALLDWVLMPYGRTDLHPIDGYSWFGEYEWAWHRNMSGCWEIGYGNCSEREGDQENAPIPCPHCCAESWGMFYECHCREFGMEPSPEKTQRCALLRWVDRRGRELVARDDDAVETGMRAYSENSRDTDSTWEVASMGNSDTWSVIDAEV